MDSPCHPRARHRAPGVVAGSGAVDSEAVGGDLARNAGAPELEGHLAVHPHEPLQARGRCVHHEQAGPGPRGSRGWGVWAFRLAQGMSFQHLRGGGRGVQPPAGKTVAGRTSRGCLPLLPPIEPVSAHGGRWSEERAGAGLR